MKSSSVPVGVSWALESAGGRERPPPAATHSMSRGPRLEGVAGGSEKQCPAFPGTVSGGDTGARLCRRTCDLATLGS